MRSSLWAIATELRDAVKQALGARHRAAVEVIESDANGNAQREAAERRPIDVSMVLFNGDEDKSLALPADRHPSQMPRPALFGLLKERSPGLMKRVIRAGADELLFLPLDHGDLTRALLKVSETRVRAGGATTAAK